MNLQTTLGVDRPVALVTGSAAPRVGRVIADRLAAVGCGVAIHSHHDADAAVATAKEIRRQHDVPTTTLTGDVTEPGIARRWVDRVVQSLGRIDILVNSAAIWFPTSLDDVTAEAVRHYFDVNTVAPMLLCRAAGRQMAVQIRSGQSTGGSIVNLGDWATVRPYVDHAAYFPSKSAVEGMTRSMAVELAQWAAGIRVNCIQPGPVLLADDVDADKHARLAASTLVGRIGSPDAVAHAVEFLCGNDFITGATITVDGGRQVYAPDGLQIGLNTG